MMTATTKTADETALESYRYPELLAACDPLVTSYRSDLDADRDVLLFASHNHSKPVPYLHFARPMGTHINMLYPFDSPAFPPAGKRVKYLFSTADRNHILEQIVECVRYSALKSSAELFHYFSGTKLRQIEPKEAIRIAEQHRMRVRDQWAAARRVAK